MLEQLTLIKQLFIQGMRRWLLQSQPTTTASEFALYFLCLALFINTISFYKLLYIDQLKDFNYWFVLCMSNYGAFIITTLYGIVFPKLVIILAKKLEACDSKSCQ